MPMILKLLNNILSGILEKNASPSPPRSSSVPVELFRTHSADSGCFSPPKCASPLSAASAGACTVGGGGAADRGDPRMTRLLDGGVLADLANSDALFSVSPYDSPSQRIPTASSWQYSLERYLRTNSGSFSGAIFSDNLQETCCLGLDCLRLLFSWIPLGDGLTRGLIAVAFQYAALWHRGTRSLGSAGLSCVNELMSRPSIPAEMSDFFIGLLHHALHLLRELTDSNASIENGSAGDDYAVRCTDFLRIFVNRHWQRAEACGSFPMAEFLELMYRYTSMHTDEEEFFQCLDIWSEVLDGLDRLWKDERLRAQNFSDGLLVVQKGSLDALGIEPCADARCR